MPQSPITKIQEDRFGQRKKLSQFFFFLVAQNWGKRRKERGYVRAIYSKLIELATTAKFCYDFHMGVITSFLCTTVLVCSGIYLYCITAAKTYTSKYHTVESWHCCQESRSSTFHTKRSFQMPKKTQNCTQDRHSALLGCYLFDRINDGCHSKKILATRNSHLMLLRRVWALASITN